MPYINWQEMYMTKRAIYKYVHCNHHSRSNVYTHNTNMCVGLTIVCLVNKYQTIC